MFECFGMGAEHPLFGTGVGTFMSAFSIHTKNLFVNMGAGVFDSAHNEYIQIFCVTGLFGLVSYLGFIISVLAGGVKKLKNKKNAVAFMSVLCYLIQAFFSFSIVIVAPFFWTALGILDSEEI